MAHITFININKIFRLTMYTREELLIKLKDFEKNQIKLVVKKSHDNSAYRYLIEIKRHIQGMEYTHIILHQDQHLVYENTDYRTMGNDHSEVSKTPIFKCCRSCCNALLFIIRITTRFDGNKGTYYSLGRDKGQELNKKIIIYAERPIKQSLDSDEMRINPEYLDYI